MEELFVVKRFTRTWVDYFCEVADEDYFSDTHWKPYTPYGASKFKTYDEAKTFLKIGRETYHWGGIFQIESIFISR